MKKVLALIDKGEMKGVRMHRIFLACQQLPKNKYEVHYLANDFLTEDIVKGYDFIINAWIQRTKCTYLSLWRKKYGFKYIQDVDDYWKLPFSHPKKDIVDKSAYLLEDLLILADLITCTTPFLLEKILPYNSNVQLRKNFLPINEYGFDVETKIISENQKINIGIVGGIAHFSDWFSIKGQIDKIKNDVEIQNNCNFVVAGYHKDNKKQWDKLCELFTYKKKGELIRPIVLENKPMIRDEKQIFKQEYINLFKDIDICLAPLENNEYNKAKSELRLFECAIKSTLMISNSLYKEKGYEQYCIVEGEMSYYKWVKKLMDRNLLNELKIQYQKEILSIIEKYKTEYSLEKYLI